MCGCKHIHEIEHYTKTTFKCWSTAMSKMGYFRLIHILHGCHSKVLARYITSYPSNLPCLDIHLSNLVTSATHEPTRLDHAPAQYIWRSGQGDMEMPKHCYVQNRDILTWYYTTWIPTKKSLLGYITSFPQICLTLIFNPQILLGMQPMNQFQLDQKL